AGELGTSLASLTSLLPDSADWPQAPQHLQAFQEPPTSRSPSPLSQKRSLSPVSQRRSLSPLSQRRSPSPLSSRPPGAPGGWRWPWPPAEALLPGQRAAATGLMEAERPEVPGSPIFRRNLANTDSSPHQDPVFGSNRPAGRVLSLDRDKNISFLLKELDSLRDLNQKLQAQLVQKEKELERREVEEELMEEQQEARSWERAAVLEEVLSSQKNRDQALMSRLLLANEERDEALLRAQRLLQSAAHSSRSSLTWSVVRSLCWCLNLFTGFHLVQLLKLQFLIKGKNTQLNSP
ncbi:uncharacterized protein, partial [Centroberyx affinis]|uniref:uncharacterized protein n=1 Tax=Centroberyx affinis TaxID=166261 RepID=UPI003A5BBC71